MESIFILVGLESYSNENKCILGVYETRGLAEDALAAIRENFLWNKTNPTRYCIAHADALEIFELTKGFSIFEVEEDG